MSDDSDDEPYLAQPGEPDGRNPGTAVTEEEWTDRGGENSCVDDEFERQGRRGEEITEMVKKAHDEFLTSVKSRGVEECRWERVLDYWSKKLQEVPP